MLEKCRVGKRGEPRGEEQAQRKPDLLRSGDPVASPVHQQVRAREHGDDGEGGDYRDAGDVTADDVFLNACIVRAAAGVFAGGVV